MAALDFPDAPTLNQVYDRWIWNGAMWALASTPAAVSNKTSAALSTDGAISWDTFNRANGSIGISDSGHTWTVVTGTWTVESGQARKTGTVADSLVTIPGVGDGLVGADVLDSNSRVCFRITDAANYLFARIVTTTGVVELTKREAAVQTVLATSVANLPLVTTLLLQRLEISFTGAEVTVSVGGNAVLRHTLSATDLLLYPATQTNCGMSMLATTTAARWDNFYTSKVPKHTAVTPLGSAPIGTIVDYISATAPPNWLALAGQTITGGQAMYPSLWAVLPTLYKSGADIVLPDTGGKSTFGYTSADALFNAIGDNGGSKDAALVTHTHTVDPPSHTHAVDPPSTYIGGGAVINTMTQTWIYTGPNGPPVLASSDQANASGYVDIASFTSGAYDFAAITSSAPSGTPVAATNANLPPYITFNKIIRAA